MDTDDPDFFSRLARGDGNTFEDLLRNAPRDDDGNPAQPRDVPFYVEEEPETPLQQLIRRWVNERHSPDVLPTEEDLLSRLLDHIRSQVGQGTHFNMYDCWNRFIGQRFIMTG